MILWLKHFNIFLIAFLITIVATWCESLSNDLFNSCYYSILFKGLLTTMSRQCLSQKINHINISIFVWPFGKHMSCICFTLGFVVGRSVFVSDYYVCGVVDTELVVVLIRFVIWMYPRKCLGHCYWNYMLSTARAVISTSRRTGLR